MAASSSLVRASQAGLSGGVRTSKVLRQPTCNLTPQKFSAQNGPCRCPASSFSPAMRIPPVRLRDVRLGQPPSPTMFQLLPRQRNPATPPTYLHQRLYQDGWPQGVFAPEAQDSRTYRHASEQLSSNDATRLTMFCTDNSINRRWARPRGLE